MRFVFLTVCYLLLPSFIWGQEAQPDTSFLDQYREAAVKKWEADIQELEQLDTREADPADGILLIGSSSIRLWKSSAADLAPYRTIRRGYGGARYSDLAIFAERLIQPHDYRAMVMFVANDVTGGKDDRTPDEVEQLVRYIVSVSRRHRPESPILIVEVTPTPKRYEAWGKIREVNARLREITFTEPNTYFVATADLYLDENNKPLGKYFTEDNLHQNEVGYGVWASLIRRRLDEVFRLLASDVEPVTAVEHTAQ